jgi:hypothetical protein
MVTPFEELFPGLRGSAYHDTSPATFAYNCIAWAAGETGAWWWPFGDPLESYWPASVLRAVTLPAFRDAFATQGYAPCDSDEAEPGFERIALFATAEGTPTHAARQLPTGRWTSKLGQAEDVEHGLRDLEGDIYGKVALVMRRPLWPRPPPAAQAGEAAEGTPGP